MSATRYLLLLLCFSVSLSNVSASETASRFGELAGRSRINFCFGVRSQGGTSSHTLISGNEHLALGFGTSHWFREDLAVSVTLSILAPEVGVRIGPVAVTTNGVVAALVGARWYFPTSDFSPTVRPYVTGSIGPYIGSGTTIGTHATKSVTMVSPGGHVGAGLDLQLHRSFMLGIRGGYHFMSDFSRPLAGRDNFSGFELGMELSWLFGG